MTEPVSKINAPVQTIELMSYIDKYNSLTPHAKRKKSFIRTIVFFLLIACMVMPFQQAVAGDSLTSKSVDFREKHIIPILIRGNLCTSIQDCRKKEIFFCNSTQKSTSCRFYGIKNVNVMKEIIVEIMYSNTLIKTVGFYQSTYKNEGFFEKPIMVYYDKTGGE